MQTFIRLQLYCNTHGKRIGVDLEEYATDHRAVHLISLIQVDSLVIVQQICLFV